MSALKIDNKNQIMSGRDCHIYRISMSKSKTPEHLYPYDTLYTLAVCISKTLVHGVQPWRSSVNLENADKPINQTTATGTTTITRFYD
jgi:hypothetical protein